MTGEKKRDFISHAHISCGHEGRHATLDQIKHRVSWKGLTDDIMNYIAKCNVCNELANKKVNFQKHRTQLTGAFDKIGIDIIGPLVEDNRGYKYIVAATDYLTRWTEAKALRKKRCRECNRIYF